MQEITARERKKRTHTVALETNFVVCVTLQHFDAVVCVQSLRAQSHFTFSSVCSSPFCGELSTVLTSNWHLQSKGSAYLHSGLILVIFAFVWFVCNMSKYHTHIHKKLCTACMWSCVIHWILKHDKQLNMHVIYFFVSKVLKPLWAWRKISWPWGTSSGKLWNFLNTIMCHFKHGAPTCCYWNQKYSNSLAPVGNKSLIGVCYFFNHSAPGMLLILSFFQCNTIRLWYILEIEIKSINIWSCNLWQRNLNSCKHIQV